MLGVRSPGQPAGLHVAGKPAAEKRLRKRLGARNFVVLTLKQAGPRTGGANRRSSDPRQYEFLPKIKLKSLILAQIERWRHALHMQVERQRGGNPGGERRTGE